MSADEGTDLRDALKALEGGGAPRAKSDLERALLTTSAAALELNEPTIVASVRLLQGADDNGTTRLEVRDQAMTHRRWFDVTADGHATWGER